MHKVAAAYSSPMQLRLSLGGGGTSEGKGGVSQAVRGTQYNQIGPNQIINGKITNEEGKPETDPINVRGIRIQTEL